MSYIGDREIEKIEGILVTFKEGETEEYSESMLKRIVTDEAIDLTALRDLRCEGVAENILGYLLVDNIYLSELEYVMQLVVQTFQNNRNRVEDKLWGAEDLQQTVKQLDDHLKTLFKD